MPGKLTPQGSLHWGTASDSVASFPGLTQSWAWLCSLSQTPVKLQGKRAISFCTPPACLCPSFCSAPCHISFSVKGSCEVGPSLLSCEPPASDEENTVFSEQEGMTLKSDLTLADWPQGSHVPCLSLYFLIHYRVHWYLPCRVPAPDKAVSVPGIAAGPSWLRLTEEG